MFNFLNYCWPDLLRGRLGDRRLLPRRRRLQRHPRDPVQQPRLRRLLPGRRHRALDLLRRKLHPRRRVRLVRAGRHSRIRLPVVLCFQGFFIVRMQNKASKSWVQWWRNAFRSSLWRNKGQKGEKEMSLMKASSYKVRSGRNVVFTSSSQDRITVFHSLRQQASRSQKNHTIRSN